MALRNLLISVQAEGKQFVDVRAGDLHRIVGGYPGPNHRMPMCCEAMRRAMRPGDLIVEQPPKGKGASFVVRYRLPR